MKYQQIQPTAKLTPYIRCFGLLESEHAPEQSKRFKIIADGCPGLIFQENPDCFLDKDGNKLPQLFLHGLTTGHSEKTTTSYYRNIGVYFRPHALRSVFGIDAHALTNRYVALDSIVPNHVSEQLLLAHSIEKRIEILSVFILQQLALNSHKEHPKTLFAIESIQAQRNGTSLAGIQSDLNVTERTLERIFNTHIGVSPKLFARIDRFQQALDHLRKQPAPFFTGVAYQHAYADQSHFIRDFKEFAGSSPKQFLQHAHEQAVNFPEWK